MIFELRGKLKEKYDTKNVSKNPEKPFYKREFVVELTETSQVGTFTETILFELLNDKCNKIDSFQEGEGILVKFGIKGRAWQPKDGGDTRYFNSLNAWGITHVEAEQGSSVTNANDISMDMPVDEDDIDGLPF